MVALSSSIDGGNKLKLATGETLGTGTWAPDNFHSTFEEGVTGAGDKAYIVGADGSGLRQLPSAGADVEASVWSPDQKTIQVSGLDKESHALTVWKWSEDGSTPEKLVDNCGMVSDADPGGQYLLAVSFGEKTGIYEVSISDRKCGLLLPDVATETAVFARDGKSFLYAVASRGQVTIYRQSWKDGKTIGTAQFALKVPFSFPLSYAGGNAYDFSRDFSTIVYARPGGHTDLYLLSQK